MLQSFLGICDGAGLRTLRCEEDGQPLPHAAAEVVRFWVIIDSAELPRIGSALGRGEHALAWQLLVTSAKSLGPWLPDAVLATGGSEADTSSRYWSAPQVTPSECSSS